LRKAIQVSTVIKGVRDYIKAEPFTFRLLCSVRNHDIGIGLTVGDSIVDWPHLTIHQAHQLKRWLERAIPEAERREAAWKEELKKQRSRTG
jgi:hypothetical protein